MVTVPVTSPGRQTVCRQRQKLRQRRDYSDRHAVKHSVELVDWDLTVSMTTRQRYSVTSATSSRSRSGHVTPLLGEGTEYGGCNMEVIQYEMY